MRAASAVAQHSDGQVALDLALQKIEAELSGVEPADLAFLFASSRYWPQLPELVATAKERTRARVLVGCTGQGVIGTETEIEQAAALSLMVLSLPGAELAAVHLTQPLLNQEASDVLREHLKSTDPDRTNAWILFADPFTIDCEALLHRLGELFPGVPVVGGLASASLGSRRTAVFVDRQTEPMGAVAVSIGGGYSLYSVISQGCRPIGEAWTITGVNGHLVETISSRPAYEVLLDTLRALSPLERERVHGNLFVGLAMDEYRECFGRGDFLIRNLLGVDQGTGSLAIGAHPRLGQTVQFQLRDAQAADEDLRELLSSARQALGGRQPLGALLCSCNGRGAGLFGVPDHDARVLAEAFGRIPVAGFFCNGEIGPVGPRNFLHGFTASIALLLPPE